MDSGWCELHWRSGSHKKDHCAWFVFNSSLILSVEGRRAVLIKQQLN